MSNKKAHWLLFVLPVLGIIFWFLLGFPMADRNESYIWITYLQQHSLLEIIQNPIPSIRSFRPLAQVITWCLYHISGSNGVLVQFINFVLLCAAIWIMVSLTPCPKSVYARFLYFLTGLIYFPSFYYMFNLHGIFYSAIFLVLALFIKTGDGVLRNWKKWSLISCLLAFFHPFILIFFAAYLAGWIIEKKQFRKNTIIIVVCLLGVLTLLLEILLPFPTFSVIDFKNLSGTLRNIENYTTTKIFTLSLCLLTILIRRNLQTAWILIISGLYIPMALIFDQPVMLLLAFLIITSLALDGKWALAGLVGAAISFPLAVGSGAPTKASIFIFLVPHVMLEHAYLPFAIRDRVTKSITLGLLLFSILCAFLLRQEVEMPLLSDLVRPLLVERGKTYQLKKALQLASQQSPRRRILFLQEKQNNIRDGGQPTNRDNFPPTKQTELDVFQDYSLQAKESSALPIWYLAFGKELSNDTLTVVHTLQEKNSKPAFLYEPLSHR